MQTTDNKPANDSHEQHQEVDDVTQIQYFGGHDYDGIKELDNPLPPFLKYIFYITIVISVSYLILLFVFEDKSIVQKKEYYYEMAAAKAKDELATEQQATEAAELAPPTEAEILASGKSVYDKTCLVCHGKFGEGLVGPNFTDEYWLHGGRPEDLKKVITEGIIEKGMISYKSQLSPRQIDDVIAYILSLQGTNPPNPKAAQGEKFVRE